MILKLANMQCKKDQVKAGQGKARGRCCRKEGGATQRRKEVQRDHARVRGR